MKIIVYLSKKLPPGRKMYCVLLFLLNEWGVFPHEAHVIDSQTNAFHVFDVALQKASTSSIFKGVYNYEITILIDWTYWMNK